MFVRHTVLFQVANRLGISPLDVQNVIIWGNHSSTQFPDVRHATAAVQSGKLSVTEALKDDHWVKNEFIEVTLNFRRKNSRLCVLYR